MPPNKTMLHMIVEECYHLIAIHCACEPYQVAFLLNQHIGLQLKREKQDVDFKHRQLVAFYPLFHYFDQTSCSDYYLVSNKFDGIPELLQSSDTLFQENSHLTTHLIPTYKKADYFLKIEDETGIINAKKIINDLNKISQIITAYAVEIETLKSSQNLIFN